jgi:tetratricopeptide (TPR) repeat protein
MVGKAYGLRFCVLLLLCAAARGGAQQSPQGQPEWVLLEEAKALIADRGDPRLGEALQLLRRAIEQAGSFPEAEMAVAEIYFREGALALAEERLDKALQAAEILRVPEDRYQILYRLAEIYEIQDRYHDMEEALLRIVGGQPEFSSSPEAQRFRSAFLAIFLSRGLNQTLRLYRLEGASFALQAHAKLGWFYYRTGRFEPVSILHSLAALDIVITESVKELRQVNPSFEFRSLGEYLDAAVKRENIRSYLSESGLFGIAYHLGAAAYPAGHRSRAREIWRLLADLKLDRGLLGNYGELSRRQLQAPWVDPFINPSSRRIEYPQN